MRTEKEEAGGSVHVHCRVTLFTPRNETLNSEAFINLNIDFYNIFEIFVTEVVFDSLTS